jgi:hypothetical protein
MNQIILIITYLINRLILRVTYFLKHWYINSFQLLSSILLTILQELDRYLVCQYAAKNIFQPLLQKNTFINYILALTINITRLFLSIIIYSIIIILFFTTYLLWAIIPIFAVYQIFKNI